MDDTQSAIQNPKSQIENGLRLLRPSVVILCGPAACGKSTFAARHFRPTQVISSDWARAAVCDDASDQRFQTQAFALVDFVIEQRLSVNRLCVVDSTALTQPARKNLLDLARKYQVPCGVLLFDVPLETCVARDQARTQSGARSVGRAVIERQYELFEQGKASIKQEGFDQVVELRDEDLEKLHIDILFRPVPRASAVPRRPEPRRFGPPPGYAGPYRQAGQRAAQNLKSSFRERTQSPGNRVGQDETSRSQPRRLMESTPGRPVSPGPLESQPKPPKPTQPASHKPGT